MKIADLLITTLEACGYAFAVPGAWIIFNANGVAKDKQKRMRDCSERQWRRIRESKWIDMPENLVKWIQMAAARWLSTYDFCYISGSDRHLLQGICLSAGILSAITTRSLWPFFTSLWLRWLLASAFWFLALIIATIGAFAIYYNDDESAGSMVPPVTFWILTMIIATIGSLSITTVTPQGPWLRWFLAAEFWLLATIIASICMFGAIVAIKQTTGGIWPLSAIISIPWSTLTFLLIYTILNLPLWLSPFVMGAITPTIAVLGAYTIRDLLPYSIADKFEDQILNLVRAFAISLTTTLAALAIGHFTQPLQMVPLTFQLFISNAVFDSIAIVGTVWLLSLAVRAPKSEFPLPLAITGSLLVSVSAAFGSLWFGFTQSAFAVGFGGLKQIFLGRTVDGAHWSFGPSFFVMHSTLLPLLLYLLALTVCWLAKGFLQSVEFYLAKLGNPDVNPLRLTGDFLAFIGIMCAAAAYAMKIWLDPSR